VGDVVAGRFRIVERVARGSWSTVFRAYQGDVDRFVALKIMHPASAHDETLVERFRREALFVSQLTHPNTITIYDYGETELGSFYIAMEYLDGQNLADVLSAHGSLSPERAHSILVQICRSLSEVHDKGVLHRDLKPDNIFLCRRPAGSDPLGPDKVKVLDFGIAKAIKRLDGLTGSFRQLTRTGLVVGTPLYMAPEQLMEEELTPAADIYALGHILFEMLTGRAAYDDGSLDTMRIMMRHLEEQLPDLPPPLDKHPLSVIVRRATARSPVARFPDARGMLEFLLDLPMTWAVSGWMQSVDTGSDNGMPTTTGQGVPHSLINLDKLDERLPGRRVELEWLAGHLHAVGTGAPGRVLLLVGQTGIGKTRLVDVFTDALQNKSDQGVEFLARHTHPRREVREGGLWADVSLLLGLEESSSVSLSRRLRQFFDPYSSIQESHIQTLLKLLRRDPEIHSAISELKGQRSELFGALAKPFVRISAERVFVWVLEDLHNAEPLTIAFLDYLCANALGGGRLVVIGTLATEQIAHGSGAARLLGPLLRRSPPEVYRLRVGGVTEESALQVLRAVLDAPIVPGLASRIWRLAGGHPRFMVEILASLHHRDQLRLNADGAWELDAATPHEVLPPHLETLLKERLVAHARTAETGPLLIRALEAVALLGTDVPVRRLHEYVESLADHTLLTALDKAIEEALELDYLHLRFDALRFSVPLTHDILFNDISRLARRPDEAGEYARKRLRRAAELLLAHNPEPTGHELRQIVDRTLIAGDKTNAIRCLRCAADIAYRAFNLETALDSYLEAFRLSQERQDELGDSTSREQHGPEQMIVMLRLGEIYGTLGDLALAEDYLARTLALTEQSTATTFTATVRGRVLQLEGELAIHRNDLERAHAVLADARAVFEEVGDDHGIARVIVEQAYVRLLDGDASSALDPLLEALVLGELINAVPVQARARLYLSRVRLRQGQAEQAAKDASIALDLYEIDENLPGLSDALLDLGHARFIARQLPEAQQALERAVEAKLRLGDRAGLGHAHRMLAAVYAASGSLAAARGEIQIDIALGQERHDDFGAAWSSLLWADLVAEIGRRKSARTLGSGEVEETEARQQCMDVVKMAEEADHALLLARAWCRHARIAEHHHPKRARQQLERALERVKDTPGAASLEVRAHLARLSALVGAEDALDALVAIEREAAQEELLSPALLALAFMGMLLAQKGRVGEARVHFADGLARALRAGLFLEAGLFRQLTDGLEDSPGPGRGLALTPIFSAPARVPTPP